MGGHALGEGRGCTRYDWWGAPDVLDESDPMWGVYRFKQGFGGEFTPWIGAWDYPTNRADVLGLYGCYAEGAERDAAKASWAGSHRLGGNLTEGECRIII